MEIILGILLLFGAFTLGTVSSDSTDRETHTTKMEFDGTTQQAQAVAVGSLQKCQPSESASHYRNLTVPYTQPVAQRPAQTDGIEESGWDE
jgi:hypothetical protein